MQTNEQIADDLFNGGFMLAALQDGEDWSWIAENLPGEPKKTGAQCEALYRRIALHYGRNYRFPTPEDIRTRKSIRAARRRERERREAAQGLQYGFLNFYGLSSRQIARLAKVSEGTVLRRHHRARARRPDLQIPAWKAHDKADRVPESRILAMKAMRDNGASYGAIAQAFGYQSHGAAQITLKRGLAKLGLSKAT